MTEINSFDIYPTTVYPQDLKIGDRFDLGLQTYVVKEVDLSTSNTVSVRANWFGSIVEIELKMPVGKLMLNVSRGTRDIQL